jgi:peptide deformylase
MTEASSPSAVDLIPILIAPHQTLKARARAISTADTDLVRDLIPRMFASMYAAPGIGLAAPQVGHSIRLVVIDLAPGDKSAPRTLINPEIIAQSQELAAASGDPVVGREL